MWVRGVILAAAVLVTGGGGCLVPEPEREQVFSAEIGPEGGVLEGGGLTLTVPEGALSTTETLTVRVSSPKTAPDGGYHVCAPLNFRGTPEELYCVILAPES